MLDLTDRAVDVIRQAVDSRDLPEGAGLRITAVTTGLQVALAESPESDDAVVDVEGARVFVEDVLAPELEDKVLDAEVQETGRVTFAFSDVEEQ